MSRRPRAASRPVLATLVVLAIAAASAVAGCASSAGGGGSADPAALVPATAPAYVEAVVRGDGQEQRDATAALGRILGKSDPQAAIDELLGPRGSTRFARDIEPWLGDRVGAAVLSLGGRGGEKVVVAASRDDAQARDAIARLAPGAATRTYRDVDYRVDTSSGHAAAVVGGAVVLGRENGVKAAIDASKGSSLADSDALAKARGTVRQERSAFLYVDVATLLRDALGAAGGTLGQIAPLSDAISGALPATFAAALDAEPDRVRIDSAAFGNGNPALAAGSGADALAALPADAWAAAGVGELGQSVNGLLDRVSASGGIAGIGLQALLGQVRDQTGLDIRRDVLGWMGDAGVFVSGSSADDLGGALVVASKDPAATRRTVEALRKLADRAGDITTLRASGVDEGFTVHRGGGQPDVLVAAGGSRFVVAIGEHALREALDPGASLGTAPAFRDAAAKLSGGVRPSFFVDAQRLGDIVASKGGSGDHTRELREYLGAFGALVGGARRDGDVTRGEAVATLR